MRYLNNAKLSIFFNSSRAMKLSRGDSFFGSKNGFSTIILLSIPKSVQTSNSVPNDEWLISIIAKAIFFLRRGE